MKLFISSLATTLVISASILTIGANPGNSAPLVRMMPKSQAQGLIAPGAQVTVWMGSGTNIDFTRTGEVIFRAWLDDPSRFTVDFDSPLGKSESSVVHLRRNNGVNFPILPRTQKTLLTVVTDSPQGRKVYLFEVVYGSGNPQYASLMIVPDASNMNASQIMMADGRSADWADVERGLDEAIRRRLLARNSPIFVNVQSFLAYVRNGMDKETALQKTGLQLPLIVKLAEMGYSGFHLRSSFHRQKNLGILHISPNLSEQY